MNSKFLSSAFVALTVTFSSLSYASPISLSFTGNVEYYSDDRGLLNSLLGFGDVNIGDNFTAGYLIDSTATPYGSASFPGLPEFQENYITDPSHDIYVDVAGTSTHGIGLSLGLRPNDTIVTIGDNTVYPEIYPQDIWYMAEVSAYNPVTHPDLLLDIVVGFASDDTNLIIDNNDFFLNDSATEWDFGFFEINSLDLATNEFTRLIYGTTKEPTIVPEASSITLLLLGLLGLSIFRRHKK